MYKFPNLQGEERKIAIRLLKDSKFYLKKEGCICFAITAARRHDYIDIDVAKKLRYSIPYLLNVGKKGEFSIDLYSFWVQHHHPTDYYEMDKEDIYQGRLQWINWMIEQLKQ